jgi:hypothetical protein
MTTDTSPSAEPTARGSATLLLTLFARSIGLAAGVAVALLVVAALFWLP